MLGLRACLFLFSTAKLAEGLISCNIGIKTTYSSACSSTATDTFAEVSCLFETECISFSHWTVAASGCVTSTTQGACSNGFSQCTVQDALYSSTALYHDYSCAQCDTANCNSVSGPDPTAVTPFTCNTGAKTEYGTGCGWTSTDSFAVLPCILGEASCISFSYSTTSSGCTTSFTTGACTNGFTQCTVQDALYSSGSSYGGYTCAECTTANCNSVNGFSGESDGTPKQAAAGMTVLGAVIAQMLLGF
jgi:hypothetical protein